MWRPGRLFGRACLGRDGARARAPLLSAIMTIHLAQEPGMCAEKAALEKNGLGATRTRRRRSKKPPQRKRRGAAQFVGCIFMRDYVVY